MFLRLHNIPVFVGSFWKQDSRILIFIALKILFFNEVLFCGMEIFILEGVFFKMKEILSAVIKKKKCNALCPFILVPL